MTLSLLAPCFLKHAKWEVAYKSCHWQLFSIFPLLYPALQSFEGWEDVFERRTSTGSELFLFLGSGISQFLGKSIIVNHLYESKDSHQYKFGSVRQYQTWKIPQFRFTCSAEGREYLPHLNRIFLSNGKHLHGILVSTLLWTIGGLWPSCLRHREPKLITGTRTWLLFESGCVTNSYLQRLVWGCKRFFLKERKNVMFLN